MFAVMFSFSPLSDILFPPFSFLSFRYRFLVYLLPPTTQGSTYRYNLQDAVDLYVQNGKNIFSRSLGQKLSSIFGLHSDKYSNENLKNLLKSKTEGVYISQLVKVRQQTP